MDYTEYKAFTDEALAVAYGYADQVQGREEAERCAYNKKETEEFNKRQDAKRALRKKLGLKKAPTSKVLTAKEKTMFFSENTAKEYSKVHTLFLKTLDKVREVEMEMAKDPENAALENVRKTTLRMAYKLQDELNKLRRQREPGGLR